MKKQSLIRRLENSWIFRSVFLIGIIAIFSALFTHSITGIPAGYLFFPLGILIIYGFTSSFSLIGGYGIFVYDAIYYGILGFIVYKIVKDKRFNTKLILLLLGILILTFIGYTKGGF